MTWLARWQAAAEELERQVYTLYLAYRHPATPWYAKGLALLVAAYSLSPIDLIPDFIPLLGYLDDLLIVPAGVLLVIRLVPPSVLAECRAQAAALQSAKAPAFGWMRWVVIVVWIIALGLTAVLIYRLVQG